MAGKAVQGMGWSILDAGFTPNLVRIARRFTVPVAVTNNSGNGVYVGDLTSATFKGASTVTGNGQSDISCNSTTAVTRGALVAAGSAARTNCTN
jgi:hypothetical protein